MKLECTNCGYIGAEVQIIPDLVGKGLTEIYNHVEDPCPNCEQGMLINYEED